MNKCLLMLLCASCAHTPTTVYRCPSVHVVNETTRPWDASDSITLKNAKEHCATKSGKPNVCLIKLVRKPDQNFFALCGITRPYLE